jgi:hypothetical protein
MRNVLPILILLASCGIPRTAKFPVERVRGIDGAWMRVIKGKEIRMEATGDDLRVQHGALNFRIVDMPEFQGSYSYYTFEIVSADFNVFYSPKGLTVRYRNEFHHWEPPDLPTDVLIVIDGVDLRLEGLERDAG